MDSVTTLMTSRNTVLEHDRDAQVVTAGIVQYPSGQVLAKPNFATGASSKKEKKSSVCSVQ
jgi:hypothetical protein